MDSRISEMIEKDLVGFPIKHSQIMKLRSAITGIELSDKLGRDEDSERYTKKAKDALCSIEMAYGNTGLVYNKELVLNEIYNYIEGV